MKLDIPGYGELSLDHAVMDYNGTLAVDIVCPSILSALGLLENPLRLKATLRS